FRQHLLRHQLHPSLRYEQRIRNSFQRRVRLPGERRMRNPAPPLQAPFGVPTHALGVPYLARVTSADDPERLARVKVELYNFDTERDVAMWARVAVPFAGGERGAFFIPSVGDEVVVVFLNGDARAPIVVGSLWNGSQRPPETIGDRVDR